MNYKTAGRNQPSDHIRDWLPNTFSCAPSVTLLLALKSTLTITMAPLLAQKVQKNEQWIQLDYAVSHTFQTISCLKTSVVHRHCESKIELETIYFYLIGVTLSSIPKSPSTHHNARRVHSNNYHVKRIFKHLWVKFLSEMDLFMDAMASFWNLGAAWRIPPENTI